MKIIADLNDLDDLVEAFEVLSERLYDRFVAEKMSDKLATSAAVCHGAAEKIYKIATEISQEARKKR